MISSPPHPVSVLGTGVLCRLGRTRAEVVPRLREGVAEPVVLTLPDLGLGPRFLFQPVDVAALPAGKPRHEALVESVVEDALAEAALTLAQRRRLGLFVGSSSIDLASVEAGDLRAARRRRGWGAIADHLAERFEIRGRRQSFSTACSSAANALLAAMEQVAAGRLEQALVVGVETANQLSLHGFNSLRLLSDHACRPFDADRSGMVLGEGAVAVVIGRDEGRRRLLGGANRSDPGNITRPSPEGMLATMEAALAAAGLEPEQITAVKAHGTGTESNDAAEGKALRRLFGQRLPPVSSIKPALGYTLGANALLELVAWSWCLDAGFLPPTANFRRPDPAAGVAPISAARSTDCGDFLMNCFGFGGNNVCLVLAHA